MTDILQSEINTLERMKQYLNLGIERAFAKEDYGRIGAEAWADLVETTKAHGHYSMVTAAKDLTAKDWEELIDETITRLTPHEVVS